MNRETQAHFARIPSMDISRSKFDRSFNHTTTGNLGELIPVYVDPDIVPGDSVFMKMSDLIRMTTPVCPTMGDLKADFYWFFCPNRLVWDHFKRFWGENDTAPWIQQTDYQIPQLEIDNYYKDSSDNLIHTNLKGSILDHMGIPTTPDWKLEGSQGEPARRINFSALPTRAYCLIWNEFFRSEALQNPVNVPKDDTKQTVLNEYASSYVSDPDAAQVSYAYRGGFRPLKTCKAFDYFTAALPQPQAGKAVTLPMNGQAPIKYDKMWDSTNSKWVTASNPYWQEIGASEGSNNAELYWSDLNASGTATPDPKTTGLAGNIYTFVADLSSATGATINQLRTAFAIQKWQEREARGGQRYIESVLSHYRVSNPDYRLQRPEYLGGYTHAIQVNQVLNNSDITGATSPLGTTGAYSLTTHTNGDVFSHSFTEHGILMCLMTIRQSQHIYQQGINRAWLKKDRVDFYTPEFANLGETYITVDEIYAKGIAQDKDAFGYQERWAEMRYMPDMVTNAMRSNYDESLDVWHYADYYTSKPQLGNKWIQETDANLKRTLALPDEDQFKIDLYFGAIYTRPLPMWSVPGLLDHH